MNFFTAILVGALFTSIVCAVIIKARMTMLTRRAEAGKYFTFRDRSLSTFSHACGMFGAIFLGGPITFSLMFLPTNSLAFLGDYEGEVIAIFAVGVGYLYGLMNWRILYKRYSDEFEALIESIKAATEMRRSQRKH